MKMRKAHDRITTTIEREWLAQIVAGTKKIEYLKIMPYRTKRFSKVSMPFELKLLNGMNLLRGSDGADPQDHEGSPGGRI
jgi:hypothetical protein